MHVREVIVAAVLGVLACGFVEGAPRVASSSLPPLRFSVLDSPTPLTFTPAEPWSVPGGSASAHLGSAVALSGDVALVGSPQQDFHGAAYVFVEDAGAWAMQAELVPADGGTDDSFGHAVALDGDTALVGAFLADHQGASRGAAYVFVRNGNTWTQQAKLVAQDGEGLDLFGVSVALSGDTAIVGAFQASGAAPGSGAAYVFLRTGGVWTQSAKLMAHDGVKFDDFGISVGIAGNTAIVGADTHGAQGEASGAAYMFVRTGETWEETAKLLPEDGGPDRFFGNPVTIAGDTVVVGTYLQDGAATQAGAAYVFERHGSEWQEQARLTADDGNVGDHFGISVDICGNDIVVGAAGDDDAGKDAGALYIFQRADVGWSQRTKLLPGVNSSGGEFGSSVALSPWRVMAGVPYADNVKIDSGLVCSFSITAPGLDEGACDKDEDCPSGGCVAGQCTYEPGSSVAAGGSGDAASGGGGAASGPGGGDVVVFWDNAPHERAPLLANYRRSDVNFQGSCALTASSPTLVPRIFVYLLVLTAIRRLTRKR